MSGKMFFEVVHSEGLAHMSYILGHGGKAAVVDPRRDCQVYVDIAYRYGSEITHIFETHRNEDYIVGSRDLASRTGAKIYHGSAVDFRYGNPVSEGDSFELGNILLGILETPGHTFESISITLADKSFSDQPIAVFTGDALFIGDVGRTDFFPDRAEEVAGLLHDSIFKKLLPLGEHVILHPAHGAGSICGQGMAAREFSTLGYEKKFNLVLQKNREEFITYKVNEHHYKPPYFAQMERLNHEGSAPLICEVPSPKPMNADRFSRAMEDGMFVLDTRSPEAFGGGFIPGSLSIPLQMIPAFAGFFVPYDRRIGLVVEHYEEVERAVRFLLRMGYDEVVGFMEGLTTWEQSGRTFDTVPAIHAEELVRRIRADEQFTLLDVRQISEVKEGRLPNSTHIYVGDLQNNLDKVPKERPISTFCGSGQRAIIAASILKRNGFDLIENNLGSMAACAAIGCPIVKEQAKRG